MGFDYRTYTRWGNRLLQGANKTLVLQDPGERLSTPQETDPDLSVSVQESPAEAWVNSGLLQGQGYWTQECVHKAFWRRSPSSSLPLPNFGLRMNIREGTQPCPSTENWIKDYWAWPCPSEQNPVSLSVSLSHQEASISLLSLSLRGQTEWKPQSQKNNQTDHMDHSLV